MVIWSHRARADLKSIYEYIHLDSSMNAKKVILDIYAKVGLLEETPQIGKMVADINEANWREISVHSWRIIYHLRSDTVSIATVIHKRKLLNADDISH